MRVLISRPDRIGDVVLSTAIPREIKKQFPGSFVAVLVRNYTKDIFLNNPWVDEILLYEPQEEFKKEKFFSKLNEIKKYKFTHALMLLPNERINYMLFLAGIKDRYGSGHKLFQMLTFTKSVSRNKYIPLRHEADYCMDMARRIGVTNPDISPEIYLTETEKKQAEDFRYGILPANKKLIGIHVSSGSSAPNWEKESYLKLFNILKLDAGYLPVITDSDLQEGFPPDAHINLNSDLRSTIIRISALDCLVSASTGPMHIASALKVDTVSLFCPLTACSPKLWGPLGNKSQIILPPEDFCKNHCPGDPHICSLSREGGVNVEDISIK